MEKLNKKIHDKPNRPVKVLQFGEGNFLRAFVDWIIQKMNEKGVFNGGVCVVQPMPFGRVKELAEQDGLYTLILQGRQNGQDIRQPQIIDVLEDFINPFEQYDKYLEYAKSEDLEFIISNTTEAGIAYDPNDTDLTVTPKSYPGKLLAFLKKRYEHFNGSKEAGLDIIPCELIDYNGDTLKEVLVKLANHLNLDQKFITWLTDANRYYNTLVDRIVPGYPRGEDKKLWEEFGYEDNNMVVGEIFHLWVIQGPKGLEAKLPAPKAGLEVLFVDNIKPYKERKVKILNGSHTCLVPVSYLAGIDTVRETIEDPQLGKFVKEFIFNEVVPTINIPRDQMVSFSNSVLERYSNPFVRHELMSIALNSVTKFKTRVLPTIVENIRDLKHFPTHALFSLAALMVFYRGKRGDEDIALQDNPEFLDLFKKLWSEYENTQLGARKLVEQVLGLKEHWEIDLNELEGVTDFVASSLYEIVNKPMREALVNKVGC